MARCREVTERRRAAGRRGQAHVVCCLCGQRATQEQSTDGHPRAGFGVACAGVDVVPSGDSGSARCDNRLARRAADCRSDGARRERVPLVSLARFWRERRDLSRRAGDLVVDPLCPAGCGSNHGARQGSAWGCERGGTLVGSHCVVPRRGRLCARYVRTISKRPTRHGHLGNARGDRVPGRRIDPDLLGWHSSARGCAVRALRVCDRKRSACSGCVS